MSLPTNETLIQYGLLQHGPLSVCLNAGWLQLYIGGVLSTYAFIFVNP